VSCGASARLVARHDVVGTDRRDAAILPVAENHPPARALYDIVTIVRAGEMKMRARLPLHPYFSGNAAPRVELDAQCIGFETVPAQFLLQDRDLDRGPRSV